MKIFYYFTLMFIHKHSKIIFSRQKYSLNEISHDSAIALIKLLQKNDVNVSEVYIDTVGPPEKYEVSNRIFKIIIHSEEIV